MQVVKNARQHVLFGTIAKNVTMMLVMTASGQSIMRWAYTRSKIRRNRKMTTVSTCGMQSIAILDRITGTEVTLRIVKMSQPAAATSMIVSGLHARMMLRRASKERAIPSAMTIKTKMPTGMVGKQRTTWSSPGTIGRNPTCPDLTLKHWLPHDWTPRPTQRKLLKIC